MPRSQAPPTNHNLNIPRYVDAGEPEDLHDLDAHLNGGIPHHDVDALHPYWDVFPSLRDKLFKDNGRDGYSDARAEPQQVKATILEHGEFTDYSRRATGNFEAWREDHEPRLKTLDDNDLPKDIIHTLSEDLLTRFADMPLINRYDIYQRLVDYWADTMEDDVYLVTAGGWMDAAKPRVIIADKDKKIAETPDLTIKRKRYKMDLIPPTVVVQRFFFKEQAAVEALQSRHEIATRALEEFVEENSSEGGTLEDTINDKGKVTRVAVKQLFNAVKDDPKSQIEYDALTHCLHLLEAEARATKSVKDAQEALDTKTLARYAKLTEAEIKTLVVERKWFANLRATMEAEVSRLTQQLADRVRELNTRYARPLPIHEQELATFSAKVEGHLARMGLTLK